MPSSSPALRHSHGRTVAVDADTISRQPIFETPASPFRPLFDLNEAKEALLYARSDKATNHNSTVSRRPFHSATMVKHAQGPCRKGG